MESKTKSIFTALGVFFLILITFSSTVYGGIKILKSIDAKKVTTSPSEILGAQNIQNTSSPTPAATPNAIPFKAANKNNNLSTASIVTTKTNTTDECIITLFGSQYNVKELKNSHSGGDVFRCGQDMTATYQSRHGTNISMMVRYKVGSPGSSNPISTPLPVMPQPKPSVPVSSPIPQPSPVLSRREEDDDRDEIEEERRDYRDDDRDEDEDD